MELLDDVRIGAADDARVDEDVVVQVAPRQPLHVVGKRRREHERLALALQTSRRYNSFVATWFTS